MLEKIAKLAITCVIATLSACGQRVERNFDYEVAPTRYQESRKEAMKWIDDSMASQEWTAKEVAKLKKLKKLLEDSSLNYVANQEGTPCYESGRTAAFVLHPNSQVEIFVCELADNYSTSFIAQVLVHETVHLGGIFDECETTRFELEITRNSGRIPFKNGYVDRCGLE